jgi:hypothetical protein
VFEHFFFLVRTLFQKCSNTFFYSVRTLFLKCSNAFFLVFERSFFNVRTLFFLRSNTFFLVFERIQQSVRTQTRKCSNTHSKNVQTLNINSLNAMFERGVPKLRTERSNIMFFLYVRTFEKTCTDVAMGD